MRSLLCLDDTVETIAGQRESKSSRNNAKDGGGGIGREADAEQSRGEIDEPKRKDRDEPQEQEVAEGILLEALAKARKPGACPRREELAERASRNEKHDRCAERGGDEGGDARP